jgi:hypothetical protein
MWTDEQCDPGCVEQFNAFRRKTMKIIAFAAAGATLAATPRPAMAPM